jgi:tetratricopeptide (TPR) repeat protein
MQDFLQGNFDDTNESLERLQDMHSAKKEVYFDVHQIENLFEYYLESNEFDKAEHILTVGMKQHPSSIALKIKSTVLLAERGFFDEAIAILESYNSIEQYSAEIYMSLGWLYLKKGFIDESMISFDRAIELAGEDAENFLLDIGFNLNQEGFYNEAIYYLAYASVQFEDNENILFELAFAYDKTEQIELGIETYLILLDINPYFENAWYNLGILYNKQGEFQKAIDAYEYSIAINVEHSESYFNMGNSYAHMGIFDKALDFYHIYASYGNDPYITYQYIGECWEQLNKPEMALRFYQLILSNNDNAADAWYGMGTALIALNLNEDGISALNHALELNPENPDYWFAYARGCYETNKIDKAIQSLETGLSYDPEEVSAWIELVQLHMQHSEDFNFIEFIDNALTKYPTVGAVSYIAAVIYFKYAKDKDLALGYLKVGKRRQPDDIQIVLNEFPELLSAPEISKYINKKVKNVNKS